MTLGLMASPGSAQAHLVTTGLGPVYDGLVHYALAPEDLVPVLALAALAGLRGAPHGRRVLLVLPIAWLLGRLLGLSIGIVASPLAPVASFLLLGGLVAADPLAATSALALILGLLHGYLNDVAMARPGLGALGVIGVVICVFTLTALVTSLVVPLRAEWPRVAVRVAGSWIAAVGLLLLGWTLRPGA